MTSPKHCREIEMAMSVCLSVCVRLCVNAAEREKSPEEQENTSRMRDKSGQALLRVCCGERQSRKSSQEVEQRGATRRYDSLKMSLLLK